MPSETMTMSLTLSLQTQQAAVLICGFHATSKTTNPWRPVEFLPILCPWGFLVSTGVLIYIPQYRYLLNHLRRWLRRQDSNLQRKSQSLLCYHYTTPQYCRSVPGCHNCGYIVLIAHGTGTGTRTQTSHPCKGRVLTSYTIPI